LAGKRFELLLEGFERFGNSSRTSEHAEVFGEHKQPNAPANMTPARVVFTQECSCFWAAKRRARFTFGRGHTNGDAFVYFPALKTLHTGDMMAGTTPLIDYTGGGSLKAWTETLDGALKLDFDTVMPGHGPVTTKAGLVTYRNKVRN
jgi:glyoxylase-like metal-dependent hydrolase (beta-lactamase superfamily II)